MAPVSCKTDAMRRRSRCASAIIGGLILSLLIGCTRSNAPSATRTPQPTVPQATDTAVVPPPSLPQPSIGAVHFIDARRGWALRAQTVGSPEAVTPETTVLRTTDGGASWTVVTSVPFALTIIDFVDDIHGWAGGGGPGVLLVTGDGGVTWSKEAGAGDGVRMLNFVSSKVGWMQGLGHKLALTTDAGRTWTDVAVPCPGHNFSQVASFADQSFGLLACLSDGGAGFQGKRLYSTADAGRTWTEIVNALGSAEYLYELFVLDRTRAWYTTGGPAGANLYITNDGGASWQSVPLPGGRGYFGLLRSVRFVDPMHGWVVAARSAYPPGTILATEDGGATWSPIFTPG